MKNQTKQKAAALADQLHFPASDELLNLVASAGLDAIAATLAHRGKVPFPLSFTTTGDIPPVPPGTMPVYLHAALVQKLNALGECIGLEDGSATYITELLREDLADDSTNTADLIAEMWNVTDPETIAELYRIQSGGTANPPIASSTEHPAIP